MAETEPRASESIDELRRQWDGFAAVDAEYYITGWENDWNRDNFLSTGADIVRPVIDWLGPQRTGGRMLELGCGMGRTAQNFAAHFARVDAVDISDEMLRKACALQPPENIVFSLSDGDRLPQFEDGTFDFVYSYVVFQHIPDAQIIANYLVELGRVTKTSGTAILQFDTRRLTIPTRIVFAMPDFLLPRGRRKFMRRIRRDPAWIRRQLESARFVIEDERDDYLRPLGAERRSAKHHFLLRRV